jgi:hypothetical protein
MQTLFFLSTAFIYLKDNLFKKMRGRKFKGLENHMNNICLKKPAELQKRLTKYSIQLDNERYLPPHYQSTDHVGSLD